jgi:Zn-finger nucleic acid-binding protein
MECPKCEANMHVKTYGGKIRVNCCDDCGGLFCNQAVLNEMLDEWMSEVILDKGSRKKAKYYNLISDIDCPVCHVQMEKIYDPEQVHIWLEQCESCGGTFLDAGEFTDLKHITMAGKAQDFIQGKRPAANPGPNHHIVDR